MIKPSSLGDIVHALPILAGIRDVYPHAHIAWLVGTSFQSLLEGHPLLDEIIPFDRRHFGRLWRSPRALADFLRFVRGLRRRRFDLVIDLQGLFRSGFFAWVSGAPRRVGFADARELAGLFYTQRVRCTPGDVHAVDKNLCVGRALGLPVDPPRFPLGVRTAELQAGRDLIGDAAGRPLDRFIAVIPGTRWESKLWRPDRLAEVIDQLAAEGLPPSVVLGSPADAAFADEIVRACRTQLVNLVGRTSLRQLTAAIALSDLVVCHDSGPMHIAAALGKPLVAIFGPTSPARTGPYSAAARVVSLPLECAPCYRRRCPLGHHNCMQQLASEPVLHYVREIWASLARTTASVHSAR